MSEISTYLSFSPQRPPVEGATGYPQPGRRVAILADDGRDPVPRGIEGLLAVSRRDPGLMRGYWNRAEETASAFRGEWFVTGDRAVMREDGAIESRGRADDLLNAGGYRVSPAEIEAVLLDHPAVADAAAAEVPVRLGVSIVAAFYVADGPPRVRGRTRRPLRRSARALQVSARLPRRRRSAARSERQASPSPPEGDSPAMTRLEIVANTVPCPAPARRGAGSAASGPGWAALPPKLGVRFAHDMGAAAPMS